MALHKDENSIGGIVPEVGAIFMSNIATKRECFKRKIFGLPSAQADFVKQVKAGMLLFLFEFEKRELFGVFRATSDGAINIMPHAFSSSGKKFPAQVRFAQIWYCTPFSEFEFRNAIKDNYYSAKKFNFGLSKNQVHILLQLFSSRRLNSKMPRRQTAKETREVGKDRQRVDDDMFLVTDTFGPDMGDYITLSEYSEKSLDEVEGVDDDRFLMGDKVENEHKVDSSLGRGIWTDQPGVYWTKKRKINNDGRFLTTDVTGSELYNNLGPRHSTSADCLGDSFGKMKSADDDMFLMNGRLQNKRYVDDCIGSVISTEHIGNSLGRVARTNDVRNFLMSEREETDCHISSQHFGNPMDKFRRETVDRLEIEHNMVNDFEPDISTKFSRYTTLCKDKLLADDGRFRKSDRVENVRDIDSHIGSAFSSHITASCETAQNLFMNSIKRNPKSLFMSSIKPNLESDSYSLHDQIQHSSAFLHPNGPQTFAKSYSTSHDSAVTKTVPYDPDFPDVRYLCSSPLLASHNFNSAQDHSSHQGSEENFIPLSNTEGLTHLLESKRLARCLDVASGNGNKISSPNTYDHHNQSCYRSSNTFLNYGYPESSELRTSESKGSKDSLYSDSVLSSLSFPNGRSTVKLNEGPLLCAFSPSKNPSFAFDKGYLEEPQDRYELKISQRERNEAFKAKEFHPSDTAWSCSSCLHYGSSPQDQEKNPVNHTSELYSDTKNDRTSVFTRLSVAPEVCLQEDDNGTYMARNECDMDASGDEVMDLLHQAHNHWVKVEEYRPNDGNGNIRYKEKSKFQKRTEFEQPMVTKKQMEIDTSLAIKENVDTVFKETRLIDFKRRSRMKKDLDENITKRSDGISEGTASVGNAKPSSLMSETSVNAADEGLMGKAGKSRKLIRPDFGKKECCDESKDGDSTPYGRPPFEESSHKNNTASCKDALKSLGSTDMVSCNAGVAHATLPATSDNNTTSEQTPGCKLSGTSEALINQDSEDGKELLQDIKIGNTISQVPPNESNQNVRAGLEIEDRVKVSIQDLLRMISSSSSAQISSPVLTEVTADPGI